MAEKHKCPVCGKYGDAHVFAAEQVNGKTVFYDPQKNSTDCSSHFRHVLPGYTKFCRIDNLEPTSLIEQCCTSDY